MLREEICHGRLRHLSPEICHSCHHDRSSPEIHHHNATAAMPHDLCRLRRQGHAHALPVLLVASPPSPAIAVEKERVG